MIHPVEKNENGEYFISADYYLNECCKYEEKIVQLKRRIKKQEKENYKLKERIAKLLNDLRS